MIGRTQVFANSDAEISIINPSSYRSQVITLMAEDVKQVTDALGDDYKVVLTGIDRPVKWGRVGSVNVAIYIPYEYVVLPSTVHSLMSFPDY
ncbi:MAG: hypothetical protein NXH85_15840 [Pseudomonadaceae bacterium]|nr:hypothetical protein [Pseudomonadaceae bacterium]